MLAAGFGREFNHNADAQEYEHGSEAELFEAVKLCVELGLDVNVANAAGETALFWAGQDAITYSVAHGARMDVKNTHGRTAFDKALARRDRTGRQLAAGLGGGVSGTCGSGDRAWYLTPIRPRSRSSGSVGLVWRGD